MEGENTVVDFDVTLQLVNFAVFFLMHCADIDWLGTLGGGGRQIWLGRGSGQQLAGY